MLNNSQIKEMIRSNKIDTDQLKSFKDYLETMVNSNVYPLSVPVKLNKKIIQGYQECIPLLEKAVTATSNSETVTYLQGVVKILDAGWEYLFQQALTELSATKLQKTYDNAINMINYNVMPSGNQPWAEIVVMINELRN